MNMIYSNSIYSAGKMFNSPSQGSMPLHRRKELDELVEPTDVLMPEKGLSVGTKPVPRDLVGIPVDEALQNPLFALARGGEK